MNNQEARSSQSWSGEVSALKSLNVFGLANSASVYHSLQLVRSGMILKLEALRIGADETNIEYFRDEATISCRMSIVMGARLYL